MMGRSDVASIASCLECDGTGLDRKKRTRRCPHCFRGRVDVCISCCQVMPCLGTSENTFDQSWCLTKDPKPSFQDWSSVAIACLSHYYHEKIPNYYFSLEDLEGIYYAGMDPKVAANCARKQIESLRD